MEKRDSCLLAKDKQAIHSRFRESEKEWVWAGEGEREREMEGSECF